MFETSFVLVLEYLILNIIVPFIPGLLFLWIFYGQKFKGILLRLLSRFIGSGVIAFSLLNIQFIHFGVGLLEYTIVLLLLLTILIWKICIKKESIKIYMQTLKIKNISSELVESFKNLSKVEKIFTIILSAFSIYFVCITGISNFNLPTYGIDTFDNWNRPAYNIYVDGGVKLFGDESEILGRGRLGYPIHIAIYKSLIFQFTGGINDIYSNTRQRLLFLFGLLFIFFITFDKTKNIFKSILPVGLIISLPLIFFHSFEGYMDIPLSIYCIICLWLFYNYLEKKDNNYLSLGLLCGFIISYLKNDGFVIFFPGLLLSLFIMLCIRKELIIRIKNFIKDGDNLWKSVGYVLYFFLPFLIIKIIDGLGFNQAAYHKSGMGLSGIIHWEIFPIFYESFFKMDNYNVILLPLLFIFAFLFVTKKVDNRRLFIYAGIIILLLLVAVFLFADNYQWVLNQTINNRSFTMVFIILLGFSGYLFNEKNTLGKR